MPGPGDENLNPKATPGGTLFKEVPAVATGPTSTLLHIPKPGDVLRDAAGPGEVYLTLENVLKTYTNIGVAGCTPDHQWRAAPHFRPFHALGELTAVVEELIRAARADVEKTNE